MNIAVSDTIKIDNDFSRKLMIICAAAIKQKD
jgi:hypothetical protein